MGIMNVVVFYVLILCIIETSSKFNERSVLTHVLHQLNKFKCNIHDLINTYKNEVKQSPYHARSIDAITQSWRSTFPNGNYRTDTKNSIPFSQMNLRDPDTVLRMAEYQAMVYCQSTSIDMPSDISSIRNMASKNLRVGNFTIEATGFDEKHILFWYIASNIAQQSIILVHRGTSKSNFDDVLDDLDRDHIHNTNDYLNINFPFLTNSNDVYVDAGFYERFQNEKVPIVTAVRDVLNRYANPSFSFVVVGHSLGAAWAFLNAAFFTTLNDVNQRMSAIYTFGQPLLGSASFVNQIVEKFNRPVERYVRVVNRNDLIPHIGCRKCIQPEFANEKWVMMINPVQWKDCQGGEDPTCSSGLSCRHLSWANHSAVGSFSMRGEFCRIATNA